MPVETVGDEIRVRVRMPDEFARIRQVFPQDPAEETAPYNDEGIRAVGGPLKRNGKVEIQGYRFSLRDRWTWTPESAETWVRDQGEVPKGYSEPLDSFDVISDFEFQIVKNFAIPSSELDIPDGIDFEIIEGAASTDEVDREGDSIEQASVTIQDYEANPILCDRHHIDDVIGRVISLEKNVPLVKDGKQWRKARKGETPESRGLWIRAAVIGATVKAKEILAQVKTGLVRALSVRGHARAKRQVCHVGEGCHDVLSGLNLIEISIVPAPANQGTLFSIAKSYLSQIDSPAEMIGETEKEDKAMPKVIKQEPQPAEPAPAPEPPAPAMPEGGELPPDVLQRLEAVEAWGTLIEDLVARVAALEGAAAADAVEEPPAAEPSAEEPAKAAEPAPQTVTEKGVKKSLNPSAAKKGPKTDVGIAVEKNLEASKKIAEAAFKRENRIE